MITATIIPSLNPKKEQDIPTPTAKSEEPESTQTNTAAVAPVKKPEAPEAEEATDASEAPKPSSGKFTEYTVKEGDTLWIIAKDQYGDATFWKRIEDANGVENVSNLKLGQKLKIPR